MTSDGRANERVLPSDVVATLADHVAAGGGNGLDHARSLDPAAVIEMIDESGLRGRGGAGFPTSTKWRGVRANAGEAGSPTWVVCNAAEGEPGTYKDRPLMERNPYAVLEGILIAMHAVGAQRGFIGIKERFVDPVDRLIAARDELVEAGWAADDELVIVPGPDDYLLGEEKAILEVVEGKPALPRISPPYEAGLFATMTDPNPTVVNNVETMAHVSQVLANGSDWFRELGTESSPGTMVFTVTGDVGTPGYWELPLGLSMRALIEDIAEAKSVKAIFGGTSNTVALPALLDTPLDFDAMADAGTGLGSGGFVVYDEDRCIVKVLRTLTKFLADESCAQCLACKLGTTEIYERLDTIERGDGDRTDLSAIANRVPAVTDLARCYLPTGAQLMVGSAIQHFEQEFVDHLGATCGDDRPVELPLIDHIDNRTGAVTLHPAA